MPPNSQHNHLADTDPSPDQFGAKVRARLEDFGFGKLHDNAYLIAEHFSAIRNHVAIGNVYNANRLKHFGVFLEEHNIDLHSEQARELAALNADIPLMENFIEGEYNNFIHGLNVAKTRPPLGQELSAEIPLCDFNGLLNLVSKKSEDTPHGEGVNLEIPVILATSYYVELEELMKQRGDPTRILKLVYAIKAICAPFAEVTALDGESMGLNSLVHQVQLESELTPETYNAILVQAKEMIESLGTSESVAKLSTEILDGFGIDAVADETLPDKSGHGVKYAIGTWDSPGLELSDLTLRLVWRVKPLGSLMKRLRRIETSVEERTDAKPTDVLAMTLVTKNAEQSGMVLEQLTATLIDPDSIRYTGVASPKREEFIHAKGDSEFRSVIKETVAEDIHDLIDLDPEDSDFKVAKVTFHYTTTRYKADGTLEDVNIPVEIQILTEEARLESRIEAASHTVYKAGTLPKEEIKRLVAIIKQLHARRREMSDGEPTEQSLERGDKDLKQMKQKTARHFGWVALGKDAREGPKHKKMRRKKRV